MEGSQAELRILIVYYSRFGVIRSLAEHIAEGARSIDGIRADLFEVEECPIDQSRPGERQEDVARRPRMILDRLAEADALIIGAPAYFGSMASPLKRLFEVCIPASVPLEHPPSRPWHHTPFHGKVGAAFTASATPHGGNEQALHSMLTLMMHLGMVIVTPGQQPPILENPDAPYGPTAVSGPDGARSPDAAAQEAARRLGQQVAEVTTWLHWGRREWERRRREIQRATAAQEGPFDPSA